MEETTTDGAIGKVIKTYFREFSVLKDCGREFWVVQLCNLLDGVAYFAMLTVSTLYLSETLGYSDTGAANLWMLCMVVYSIVGCVAGFLGDSLGIKRTLHLSVVLLVISRLAISFTTAQSVVIPALFVIAVGTAIMTPILISATKQYTTAKSQTAGFNMLYFLMNVGACVGNYTMDPLRGLPWGNRSVFMAGSVMSILCWLSIIFLMRRRIATADAAQGSPGSNAPEKKKWEAPWTIAIGVMRESAFWRFILFLFLLAGVRLVFEHHYQIYPKYYSRTISERMFGLEEIIPDDLTGQTFPASLRQACHDNDMLLSDGATLTVVEKGVRWRLTDQDQTYVVRKDGDTLNLYAYEAPVGLLNSIDPFIICFGVILSTPIVARFKLFNVILVGVTISALSMLCLVIHPGWFCGALGLTLSQGYLVIVIIHVVLFSIGEVIWSPRLYEYTAAIAPEGRAASYMGLSYVPQILARFIEGPLAGFLLKRYCPPDIGSRLDTVPYTQSPQFMCLILAAIAIASPILIFLFKGVIQKESRLDKPNP